MSDELNDSPIDDIVSGKAVDLGQQRMAGLNMIISRMVEVYARKLGSGRTPVMVKQSMLVAYKEGCDDALKVFTNMIEGQGEEQIG